MNELLQNARRSGATRVDITTSEDHITVADNGNGIMDPRSLLAFGKTDWDDPQINNENPAGMGLYSVARRSRVTIESKTQAGAPWRVVLTPDTFVGREPAPIERLDDFPKPHGTAITFTNENNDQPLESQRRKINHATCYYPVPVFCDQLPVPQYDYLQYAVHTQEWQGIRFGVYMQRLPYESTNTGINFHGVQLEHPDLPVVTGLTTSFRAFADVIDCPQLKLTLPARTRIVETDFMNQVRKEALRAIYTANQPPARTRRRPLVGPTARQGHGH